MRRFFYSAVLLASLFYLFSIAAVGTIYAGGLENFEQSFRTPPAEYGSAPFWSWNEKLQPDELPRQIDGFKAGGMGGFFIHARIGLITRYLSKDWMDSVRVSVDHAKKNGMLAYLYDEDRWPSGYAGGIVPSENPEYRQRAIHMVETIKPLVDADIGAEWKLVRVFATEKLGNSLIAYKDVTPASGAKVDERYAGKTLLYFFQVYSSATAWFNNNGYIDVMSPEAVAAFIRSTYDAYKDAVGSEFGKTVPAIFTDEPNFLNRGNIPNNSIPWTDALPDTFRAEHGYAIEDYLPLLFYETGNHKKIRLDFWTTATVMFRDAFARQIYDWCDKNNIKFTGHYMSEDTLASQIQWIGAAMPHYEYMQMPGMDHLGRNIHNMLTAKQVSSVAHQFARPLILTETYGCAGWNTNFDEFKWMADWHFALGVNFINQHLSWYTMRGCRKRDYPPCLNYQSPWWRYHKMLGEYLHRASFATSQGDYTADALVLHPISSAWAVYSPVFTERMNELNTQFVSLISLLSSRQVDYDLGDEIIIARHGSVDGGKFVVNKMAYSSVVIPPGITLRSTTVKLLEKFTANGGLVVMVEPVPTILDADNDKPFELQGAIIAGDNANALFKLITQLPHHVKLVTSEGTTADSIYMHQREIGGSRFLFFANTDKDRSVEVTARLPFEGRVREWNLFDGTSADYPQGAVGDYTSVNLHFEPAGSVLLSVTPDETPAAVKSDKPALIRTESLPEKWAVVKQDSNALTLDFIRYRREGDKVWSLAVPQYNIQETLEGTG
ncbi:MAG: glycosyl hydrolase, partial [bacterium]